MSEIERNDSAEPSIDIPAGIFGEILGELMACGFEGAERKIAYSAGFHLGKWIYVADALDDLRKDIKTGNYNPFLRMYGAIPSPEELKGIELALKTSFTDLRRHLTLSITAQTLRRKS